MNPGKPTPLPTTAAGAGTSVRQSASLRSQIALAFGALVVALGLLLSAVMGEMLKQRIQKDASASLHMVARNASKLLAGGMQERAHEVSVLAQAQALWAQGLDAPQVLQAMARSQAMQPHSLWIGATDLQGVVRASTGDLLRGQNVQARPWFGAGLQGVHVGDVHPAKLLASLLPPNVEGEPQRFVDFSAPIQSQGQTIGVLAIHGSWDWTREVMEGLLPSTASQRGLELFIFDHTGQVIFAPQGQTLAYQASGQHLPALGAHTAPQGAAIATWQDGRRYLTAQVPLLAQGPVAGPVADLGWQIVAREPVEMAFADARHAMQVSMMLGCAAAVLAALLAWLAARRLSMDLYALAQAASAVQADAASATIPLSDSNREVQTLSHALDSMARRLLNHSHDMEEQVRTRTEQLQVANAELDRQARSDPLTGLLNRRGLDAQFAFALTLAQRSGRPLSLVSVDVDHFKRINDTQGHAQGDLVLQGLARTLLQRLRSSDLVARLGGEEFVALLPDTDIASATVLAEDLRMAVAAQQHDVVGRMHISLGVSTLRPGETTSAPLLQRADTALYDAKRQGRNRVCVQA